MARHAFNRRSFVKTVGLTAIGLSLSPFTRAALSATRKNLLYIGTYTETKSEGIYVCTFDPDTGALTNLRLAAKAAHPSFLAFHPRQPFLYAVNEYVEGEATGSVSAFAIDPETGVLALLNRQSSQGGAPCHLCVDQEGRWVLTANYMSGNVALFPVEADGRLGLVADIAQHQGKGIDEKRQEGPHAHSVTFDLSNRVVLAADLGIDKIMAYTLDGAQGRLVPNGVPWAALPAGSGPRHLAFHPGGRYVFVINELNSTITAFKYDEQQGSLASYQTVPTLPEGFTGENHCADIHVTPNGRFLYGSNRGHDSIVIYAVGGEDGRLTYVGHQPTQGVMPRNFAIDPTGTYLLVANALSDTVVNFRINQETGVLGNTGQVLAVPTPVCLKFMVG